MLEYCHQRGIMYILEQPRTSLMTSFKPLQTLLRKHGAKCVYCDMAAFGAPTLKPTMSTALLPAAPKSPACQGSVCTLHVDCEIRRFGMRLVGAATFLEKLARKADPLCRPAVGVCGRHTAWDGQAACAWAAASTNNLHGNVRSTHLV